MSIRYRRILNQLMQEDNFRNFPEPVPEQSINLSSNDYLGINDNIEIKNEFLNKYDFSNFKFSSTSSRLLTGNSEEYEILENTVINIYKREACLIYNSGYHANIGILTSLCEKQDLIIADKMIHASLIDGIQLSNAEVKRYRHLDYKHLENILNKYRDQYDKVFLVTESIFSMDGDITDLDTLVQLKKKFNAFLYVDEAHAVGVRGDNGLGIAEEAGHIKDIDFIVGTFGKSVASVGAYVVCDSIFKEFLINRSRSLIYTTALPPVNLAWTNFVFKKMVEMTNERIHLRHLGEFIGDKLNVNSFSQIIPYVIGSNKNAVQCASKLRERGFYVLPIRHPTVPEGTARLRLSLKSDIQEYQLQPLIKFLNNYGKNLDQ